jgi:hypothetical protein
MTYPNDWKPTPKTRLSDTQLVQIKVAIAQREGLKQVIRDTLSNEALANDFGVHVRTIEKAIKNYPVKKDA